MDVTPRVPEVDPRVRRRRRSPATYALLALLVVGVGFVMLQFLDNATLYYRNADEAVRDKQALGSRRFRIQGDVLPGVKQVGNEVDFTIAFNNVSVAVRHRGDPPAQFTVGVPVVLEGRWQGDYFASDRILIKHSESYSEAHPDRVSNAPG